MGKRLKALLFAIRFLACDRSAHLDGYGYGTPVEDDKLYNGALDDAAYVALLIQFAENLHRQHRSLKRSLLFCAFTGEEKGLLGSNYFVQHRPLLYRNWLPT